MATPSYRNIGRSTIVRTDPGATEQQRLGRTAYLEKLQTEEDARLREEERQRELAYLESRNAYEDARQMARLPTLPGRYQPEIPEPEDIALSAGEQALLDLPKVAPFIAGPLAVAPSLPIAAIGSAPFALQGLKSLIAPSEDDSRLGGALELGLSALPFARSFGQASNVVRTARSPLPGVVTKGARTASEVAERVGRGMRVPGTTVERPLVRPFTKAQPSYPRSRGALEPAETRAAQGRITTAGKQVRGARAEREAFLQENIDPEFGIASDVFRDAKLQQSLEALRALKEQMLTGPVRPLPYP